MTLSPPWILLHLQGTDRHQHPWFYKVLEKELEAFCVLAKHPTIWATPPSQPRILSDASFRLVEISKPKSFSHFTFKASPYFPQNENLPVTDGREIMWAVVKASITQERRIQEGTRLVFQQNLTHFYHATLILGHKSSSGTKRSRGLLGLFSSLSRHLAATVKKRCLLSQSRPVGPYFHFLSP